MASGGDSRIPVLTQTRIGHTKPGAYSLPSRERAGENYPCSVRWLTTTILLATGQILELASEIWKSPQIQECFGEKHRLALCESVEYFLSNLHRIASDNYIPNDMDILYCGNHTSGVYCTEFRQSDKLIRLIDVGGQKSERRKWIHNFDDVTAILFVAALSGYDQVLEEKPTENRMFDALALFDEICKSDYFLQTMIVLFLNKKDVFEEKIKKVPLTVCFRDYSGENDLKTASAYKCILATNL